MKQTISFVMLVSISMACSPTYYFNKDKQEFDASATISKFKSAEDMNDSYFEIKENNFVEFYKTLFDSVKNTSYPGKYTKNGDTLLLDFYDKKAKDILGDKALINHQKKEILFFNDYPGIKTRLIFN